MVSDDTHYIYKYSIHRKKFTVGQGLSDTHYLIKKNFRNVQLGKRFEQFEINQLARIRFEELLDSDIAR